MKNIELLNLENTELWNEWIAYLSSLRSINEENVTNCGEYEDCVDLCLEVEVPADEVEVDPVEEQNILKNLLNNGYLVASSQNGKVVLCKKRKLELDEVVERLREEIRPYRTLFLHAQRLDNERVNAIVSKAFYLK